ALQKAIMSDKFYGLSVEAANSIGSYYDKSDYKKSDLAYQALKKCLTDLEVFNKLRPEIRRAIIKNIGIFEREESVRLLEALVFDKDIGQSDFVRSAAATAIGMSSKNMPSDVKKSKIIPLLKRLVETTGTFQNVLATGAIDGLKVLYNDIDKDIIINVADFLIENTLSTRDYFIRLSATSALGKFLSTKSLEKDLRIDETNERVLRQLLVLLNDKRRKIKLNACSSLADEDAKFTNMPNKSTYEVIDALKYLAEHDIDGFVRRRAETSLNVLRKWIKEWSTKTPTLELKIRETDR
ncbi:MAG: HEAT repeat domain-containing protein, partial [Nitrososphaeraceae archaeon]